MSKIKATASVVLSAAMLLSLASCGGSGKTEGGTTAANTAAAVTTTTLETTTLAPDKDIQAAVTGVADVATLDGVSVTKKIKRLAWWDLDETFAAAELFKSIYGIPEEGDEATYGSDANDIMDFINVAYAQRYDTLAAMISSGDSPDIFPFEISNYPYLAYKGVFQCIDDVIDLSGDEWNATRDIMKKFEWGGKNYCAITELDTTTSLMWYRRTVIDEAGLDDPYDLYQAGNWTWDTLIEMAEKFQNSGDGKYLIDGYNVELKLVCTTGTPIVGLVDGKLVSNLRNKNIERVAEYVSTLCTQEYRYPRHILNNFSPSYNAWANGDTLFFEDGTWRYQENWIRFRDRYKWDADDIMCVPFPRDPQADEYYQEMRHECYMLCSGAQNVDGYRALVQCHIVADNDPELILKTRQKAKNDFGYTDEILDLIESMEKGNAIVPVFDFAHGIGQDIANDATQENVIDCLLKDVYVTGLATYEQRRAENEGTITSRIDELNASIA